MWLDWQELVNSFDSALHPALRPPSAACNPDCWYLPAVTLTPDFWQLSVGPLVKEGTCGILELLPLVSDSVLALQILAFKELPPGPLPPVLLNKQGCLNAHCNHWAKMKSSLWEATWLRCLLSICFMYLDQFTDLKWAILIVTSSLQACWLGSSAKSVVHEAGSWLSQSFLVPNETRSD